MSLGLCLFHSAARICSGWRPASQVVIRTERPLEIALTEMKSSLMSRFTVSSASALASLALLNGCNDPHPHGDQATGHGHEDHAPPHGGTPVVVAEDKFHLELVLDASAARMQAFVLDGHLENYVALTETNFLLLAKTGGREEQLTFHRAADPASGKVPEKSSVFEANAGWLKGVREFEGSFPSITLNGTTFSNISFSFPKGSKHVH